MWGVKEGNAGQGEGITISDPKMRRTEQGVMETDVLRILDDETSYGMGPRNNSIVDFKTQTRRQE